MLMMGGSRFIYRAIKEQELYGSHLTKGEPVVVLGHDVVAVTLIKDLLLSNEWRVVGILDDIVFLAKAKLSNPNQFMRLKTQPPKRTFLAKAYC